MTDAKNCILRDKVFTLGQPDLLQVKLAQMLPPTCHDGCDGKLTVEAWGGNGNYQYTWSTGATGALAEALCAQQYNVTVRDSKACEAAGAFTVENTPQLVIELGDPVTLCVGQKHVLDAGGQWITYKWTSNTGFSGSTQKVTIQDPGLYHVEVINAKGCTAIDDFLLETSTDLLKAEFFLTANAMVGDTVVMVDVSWPLPENIDWEYPAAMERLGDLGEVIYGKFIEPGIYQIKLKVSLGECRDEMSKTISILKGEQNSEDGRLGYEKFVRNFELYPNPNNGDFDVRIELAEESPVTLSVWNVTTSLNVGKWKDSGQSSYLKHINLSPLMSGQYVLRLDHARGHDMIRFIIH